jgi:hypothetical protein
MLSLQAVLSVAPNYACSQRHTHAGSVFSVTLAWLPPSRAQRARGKLRIPRLRSAVSGTAAAAALNPLASLRVNSVKGLGATSCFACGSGRRKERRLARQTPSTRAGSAGMTDNAFLIRIRLFLQKRKSPLGSWAIGLRNEFEQLAGRVVACRRHNVVKLRAYHPIPLQTVTLCRRFSATGPRSVPRCSPKCTGSDEFGDAVLIIAQDLLQHILIMLAQHRSGTLNLRGRAR